MGPGRGPTELRLTSGERDVSPGPRHLCRSTPALPRPVVAAVLGCSTDDRLCPVDIARILELLVAGGFGSLVTQYLLRGAERRSIRADVRKELSNVEWLRWSGRGDVHALHMEELAAARRRFVAAAMIACLPRKLVEEYDRLTLAALKSSQESPRGDVPGEVSDCVDLAYHMIGHLLWSPVLARMVYPFRGWQLRRLIAKNRETESGQNLRWAYHRP